MEDSEETEMIPEQEFVFRKKMPLLFLFLQIDIWSCLLFFLLVPLDYARNFDHYMELLGQQASSYSFQTSLLDVFLVSVVRSVIFNSAFTKINNFRSILLKYALLLCAVVCLVFTAIKIYFVASYNGNNGGIGVIIAGCSVQLLIILVELGFAWHFNRFYDIYSYAIVSEDNEGGLHAERVDGTETSREPTSVSFRWILSLLKHEKWLMIFGLVALLLTTAGQLFTPLILGQLVDAVINASNSDNPKDKAGQYDQLRNVVLLLLVLFSVSSVFGLIRSYIFTLISHRVARRLRTSLFSSLIFKTVQFYDESKIGDLTSRLSSDTQVLQTAVTVNVSMLIRMTIQIIGSIGLLFFISWKLTLVMFAVMPVVIGSAIFYGKKFKNLQKSYQDELANANSIADESMSNIRTVRAFSLEKWAAESYASKIEKSYLLGAKLANLYGQFNGVTSFLGQCSVLLVVWFGGMLVINGDITAGLLSSFLIYTLSIAAIIGFLSTLYGDFQQALGASDRIYRLLTEDDKYEVQHGTILKDFQGSIEFRNVEFTYKSRKSSKILQGINFDMKPGETVALVGFSGNGKSSIMSLILRFYELDLNDSDAGEVLIDGVNIKDVNIQWLRRQIGYVPQEPVLFGMSIRDNIAFGMDDYEKASDDDIVHAAKEANAHDFIVGFPEGYDTLVGERGVRLSAGQKQRIAIARALLRKPKVLLLDEATSALDSVSEKLVQEALERAMADKTVLVIAHRLSTVKSASKILVVEQGRIVECGTYSELLRNNGKFFHLVQNQVESGSG